MSDRPPVVSIVGLGKQCTTDELVHQLHAALNPKASPYEQVQGAVFARFMWFWRHPFIRLLAPIYILLSDLLVHATDPIDYAMVEYQMPLAAEAYNLLNPFNGQKLTTGQVILKLLFAMLGILVGFELSNLIVKVMKKTCFFRFVKASRGRVFLPMFGIGMSLAAFAKLWNLVLQHIVGEQEVIKGYNYEQSRTPYITMGTGVSFATSANMIDSCVYVLDFATLALVFDTMMQDSSMYREATQFNFWFFKFDLRHIWTKWWKGYFRIFVTWGSFILSYVAINFYLWHYAGVAMIKHEDANDNSWGIQRWLDHGVSIRALIYGTQFYFDTIIVQQDWEYPTFESHLKFNLLGTNVALEGRFINMGMMICVAMIDLKCLVQTLLYVPWPIGQYTDAANYIWTITDMKIIESMGLTELNTFTQKRFDDPDCNRYLDQKQMEAKGCFGSALASHIYESVQDATSQRWMAGGINSCCDRRVRAMWDPSISELKYVLLAFTPVVAGIVVVLLSRSIIANSRYEMCRRTVTGQLLAAATYGDTEELGGGRAGHISMLRKVVTTMEGPPRLLRAMTVEIAACRKPTLIEEPAPSKARGRKTWSGASTAASVSPGRHSPGRHSLTEAMLGIDKPISFLSEMKALPESGDSRGHTSEDMSAESSFVACPSFSRSFHGSGESSIVVPPEPLEHPPVPFVVLSQPPDAAANFLLVSFRGVFGVIAPEDATVEDLLDQIIRRNLAVGIPREKVRLRNSPWTNLKTASLLSEVTRCSECILYIHAKIEIPEDPSDESGSRLRRLARRARRVLKRASRTRGSPADAPGPAPDPPAGPATGADGGRDRGRRKRSPRATSADGDKRRRRPSPRADGDQRRRRPGKSPDGARDGDACGAGGGPDKAGGPGAVLGDVLLGSAGDDGRLAALAAAEESAGLRDSAASRAGQRGDPPKASAGREGRDPVELELSRRGVRFSV